MGMMDLRKGVRICLAIDIFSTWNICTSFMYNGLLFCVWLCSDEALPLFYR